MALVLANRVQETTTTTGTGTVTLAGAMSGFQSFAVVGNTNTTYYAITSGTAWEVGIGTYSTTGPTLARTTILSSSIGGGAITLAGTSIVFSSYPAEKVISDGYGLLPVANGGTGATTLTSGYLLKGNGTSAVSASVVYDTGTNVGIGTTSPGYPLSVKSAASIGAIRIIGRTADDIGTLEFIDTTQATTQAYIQAGSTPYLLFGTATTERMRITSTGDVGIGTSAPAGKLHVVTGTNDSILFRGPISLATGGSIYAVNAANTAIAPLEFAASVFYFNAGNVGIGTSAPGQKLDVGAGGNLLLSGASTGDQFIRVGSSRSGNGYSYIDLQGDTTYSNGLRLIRTNGGANTSSNIEHRGTGQLQLITQEAAPITFLTSATERMRITSAGLVGIGTTAGGGFVNIRETDTNFEINTTGTSADLLAYNRTTSAYKQLNFRGSEFLFKVNDIEKVRIDTSGNLLVGTTTALGKITLQGNTNADINTWIRNDSAGSSSRASLIVNASGNSWRMGMGSSANNSNALTWDLDVSSPSEKMRLDTSGNLGIGVTPSAWGTSGTLQALQIKSTAIAGSGTNAYWGSNWYGGGFDKYITTAAASLAVQTGGQHIWYNAASGTADTNISFSERMRIDSSGNVGIGTTAPQGKMEIRTSTGGSVTNALTLSNYVGSTVNTGVGLYFDPNGAGSVARAASIQSVQATSGNFADLRFFTANSDTPAERMKITPGGVVVIGGGSPNAALGDMVLSKQSAGTATFALESQGSWNSTIASSAAGNMIFSNPAATERIRIVAGGNVGIGTSAPAYTLDVNGSINFGATLLSGSGVSTGDCAFELGSNRSASGNAYIDFHAVAGTDQEARLIRGGGANGAFTISNTGTGDMALYNTGAAAMTFSTTATERARIDSSGNFLVGTTSAEGNGKVVSVSTTSAYPCYAARNSAGASSYFHYFINAANSAIIGSISNNGNTGVLYNVTSDSRLKKNIADADNASSLIDALQVRKFDWKAGGEHQRYGFIAQELVEVAPEAVSQPVDPDDMMGVDYSKLVPMLIKEVQSLRARVAQLEGN